MKNNYIEPQFIGHCNILQEDVSFCADNLEEIFSKFSLEPLGGSRIDWRKQVNLKKYNVDENNLVDVMNNFLSDKDEMVTIYWDDGMIFDVKIHSKLVRKCLNYIHEETFTYWIVSSNYKWIIESYNTIELVIKEDE